ncbi:hypothetical protein F0562_004287 [Nyssa sinensis]|uniref:Uncharacterized protein n=1 Tax=Nyssa sinensis TaxID=561372 RepID=A0A5J5BY40_9ASTE|nr:hypothetical protein F0562_004287 [Nyssa sinensis]
MSTSGWLCAQSFADPVAFKEAGGGASPSLPIPSFKDPNTALAPISKAPTAASASGSVHVQSSKDPNAALVSVPVQASKGFKDPNVVLGSVPVQSFKSPKIGSSSTGKGFTKLSKKKHK